MPDDPSATYRGYRKQALYVLWRLLTDAEIDARSYRPEGEEDLAVFDAAGVLVEAVQVKDHEAPLTFSDFKPHSPVGFFARMKRRKQEHPSCRHLLASFGPLGAELDSAVAGVGSHRTAVAAKLHQGNSAILQSEAETFLEALKGNVTHPEEPRLREEIIASLSRTIVSVHPDTAIELLQYWIFEASEQRRTLTRTALLQQLQRIGDYLAVLRDHSAEWMVALRPLTGEAPSAEERERCRREYRRGVQAQWGHILTEADCPRPQRLAELHEKMMQHAAVVVRGASGQGKSSLAFRYLHDYCVEGLRFHVRFVEGRQHAARVANALRGHVQGLRLRAVVLLDLSPSDTGWVELVWQLTEIGLKVLVTVREEDFRRAGSVTPDIDIDELVLDSVTREEAERIYTALTPGEVKDGALDFDEAWARFTAIDAGPLLEFTHLVREGETLAARIDGQVSRLQAEASSDDPGSRFTNAHLRLLALAAVANAAECRLKLREACDAVGLDPLGRPLAVLENEYLIRLSGAGAETTVAGLHALRSQAVESVLLHDYPEVWGDLAVQCLPLVVDEDVERFLLSAFSRRPEHSERLEAALKYLPVRTWSHAGGVCRALLWQGVSRYERENHDTLAAALAEHDGGWLLLCDPYVGSDSTASDKLQQTLAEALKRDLPKITLTPKERVFTPLRAWAACAEPPDTPPVTETDWVLAGDLAFWLGRKNIPGPLRNRLEQLLPEPLPERLSLAELARFISGREALGDPAFTQWHARHASELARCFVRDTHSIHLADENDEVRVFFPVIIADAVSGADPDADDWHAQTMKRLELLRQLFPHRATFGSQGLGMDAFANIMMHDPTTKAIPAENLPPDRAVQLNAVFIGLVDYRHRRAESWRAYADALFRLRRAVCDCFRDLHRAWGRFLEESNVQGKTIRQVPGAGLDRINTLSHLPMFPPTAVDAWGFISENRDKQLSSDTSRAALWGNVRRFKPWQKTWREYEMGVSQVARHVLEATAGHLALKNPAAGLPETNAGSLLLLNLGNAWEALPAMQTEFRRWFARYVSAQKLDDLESHERGTFCHLWAVAFAFVHSPQERIVGGAMSLERRTEEQRRNFVRRLREEVAAVMAGDGTVRVSEGPHVIDGRRCLVVVCDHAKLEMMETLRSAVVLAIWRAAQAGNWQHLEWTPLLIEWPHIFVTHILRGMALQPAGSYLSSDVVFGTVSDFEVSAHHIMELPVPVADFDALGIAVWDSPLLAAALAFQGNLSAFALTMLRFPSLVDLAARYGLTDDVLEPSLTAFSREITVLRRTASDRFEELLNLLRPLQSRSDVRLNLADDWLQQLEQRCGFCLFAAKGDTTVEITPTLFADWVDSFQESYSEIGALVRGIVEFATTETPSA
jgi:hypothetical protein